MYMNAFCVQGSSTLSATHHSVSVASSGPISLYEPNIPVKAAQAWWNGHFVLLAATIHIEYTVYTTSSTPC